MDELLAYLQRTITDEVFSKDEKRAFKSLVQEILLDTNQVNFLRGRIFELASEKINVTNYSFMLEWIKTAISALVIPNPETAETYFSPGDACRNTIIKHIDNAVAQLQICVFTIVMTASQKVCSQLIIERFRLK